MSSRDREKERVIEGARERKSGWEEVKAHRLRRMERERESKRTTAEATVTQGTPAEFLHSLSLPLSPPFLLPSLPALQVQQGRLINHDQSDNNSHNIHDSK